LKHISSALNLQYVSMLSLFSQIHFSFPLSQNPLFSHINSNLFQQNYDPRLINLWIVGKCEHHVLNSFSNIITVGICKIMYVIREMSLACSSLFLAYTQTYLNKTTMLGSLTVGSSWNLNISFQSQSWTISPLGFANLLL